MKQKTNVRNHKNYQHVRPKTVRRGTLTKTDPNKGKVRRAIAGALLAFSNAFRVVPQNFKTDTKSERL